jgi:hypothetical protein
MLVIARTAICYKAESREKFTGGASHIVTVQVLQILIHCSVAACIIYAGRGGYSLHAIVSEAQVIARAAIPYHTERCQSFTG